MGFGLSDVVSFAAPVVGAGAGFALGGLPGAFIGAGMGSSITGMMGQQQTNQNNWDMQIAANQASQANAREQMAFQERMANTVHQREVDDLKKAGLNPMLAANAGSPAPAGAQGTAQATTMQNPYQSLAQNATSIMQLGMDLSKTEAALKKNASDMAVNEAQVKLAAAQRGKLGVDTEAAKKNIPQAEFFNDAYDLIRPLIKGIKGWMQNAPRTPVNPPKAPREGLEKFNKGMY